MKIYSLLDEFFIDEPLSICLGFFDGVHLGHLSLLNKAKTSNKSVGVIMFDDNASSIFNKGNELITPFSMRLEYLKQAGIDYVFYLPIDSKTRKISKDSFIDYYLKRLNIDSIYVGDDFHFGYQARGSIDDLKKVYGNRVHVLEMINKDGKKISSSFIKSLIKEGKVNKAHELLGHYYRMQGKVVYGFQNGTKIGFPTANVMLNGNYVIPKFGVYAGIVQFHDSIHLAMVNVGVHPTIDKLDTPLVEIHIINYNGDIYNQDIVLELLDFIRDEKTFKNIDDLKKQLESDKEKIIKNYKNYLIS